MKSSLRLKLAGLFIGLAVLLSGGISYVSYTVLVREFFTDMYSSKSTLCVSISKSLSSSLVSGDYVKYARSLDYFRDFSVIRNHLNTDPLLKYIYSIRRVGDEFYYVLDGESTEWATIWWESKEIRFAISYRDNRVRIHTKFSENKPELIGNTFFYWGLKLGEVGENFSFVFGDVVVDSSNPIFIDYSRQVSITYYAPGVAQSYINTPYFVNAENKLFLKSIYSSGSPAVRELFQDTEGYYSSIYCPIFAPNGTVDSILILEILYNRIQIYQNRILIYSFILFCSIVLGLFIVYLSIQKSISRSVRKINVIISEPSRVLKIDSEFLPIVNSFKRQWYRNSSKKKLFELFVPKEFLEIIQVKDSAIRNGLYKEIEAGILFCDIRSYTSFSENLNSPELFVFINEYLGIMSPIIEKHHGFVDKYIGDAIMGIFPGGKKAAIECSIEMLEALNLFNENVKMKGYDRLSIGIGLDYGKVTIGFLGSSRRLNATVLSDTVNTASRIESLCKSYSASLLVSEQAMLTNCFESRLIGAVEIRGKSKPVEIYEIFEGNSDRIRGIKNSTKKDFELGVKFLTSQNYTEALLQFEKVLKIDPRDKCAEQYIKIIQEKIK